MADSRIDELRRRLERDPGSRLFAQLAEEHRKAGDHGEAIRVARAGLAQHPTYASARLTLGRALLDSGDATAARAELEATLREAPDNILASRFLGQALEMVGELAAALQQLERTLKMAPGDHQLESQIVALQTRLRGAKEPEAATGGGAPAPSGATAPLRPVAPRPGGPQVVAAPAAPAPAVGEEEPLPPTIRIHQHGERPAGRAPAPPPLPRAATAAPGPAAGPPAAGSAPPLPGAPPPLPRAAAPSTPGSAVGVAAPPLPPPAPRTVRREAPEGGEVAAEPDLAPTLPTSAAAEFAAADSASAPTIPPGAVAAEETVFEAEGLAGTEVSVEEIETEGVPGVTAGGPEPVEGAEMGDSGGPLSTSTLAELYLRQGLPERAIEVYRQVVADEPENQRARARLAEIEGSVTAPDARSARRRALERTIAGLESLLAALKRR